jgi:hypothetical protein
MLAKEQRLKKGERGEFCDLEEQLLSFADTLNRVGEWKLAEQCVSLQIDLAKWFHARYDNVT